MPIPLQNRTIYGPMNSRRFGNSLGINLLPSDQKVCNFDCAYCQYGESRVNKMPVFPTLEELEKELSCYLRERQDPPDKIDWLMIAGNGEPTLYPDFPGAVKILIALRDKMLPGTPLGILSNSSTCSRPDIRQALLRLNGRFMKLDAGHATAFKNINKPSGGVHWAPMIEGLQSLRDLVLQSMFFEGSLQNTDDPMVDDWISAVQFVKPTSVQIYTLDRPPKDKELRAVPTETLKRIAGRLLAKTGIPGVVFE